MTFVWPITGNRWTAHSSVYMTPHAFSSLSILPVTLGQVHFLTSWWTALNNGEFVCFLLICITKFDILIKCHFNYEAHDTSQLDDSFDWLSNIHHSIPILGDVSDGYVRGVYSIDSHNSSSDCNLAMLMTAIWYLQLARRIWHHMVLAADQIS